MPFLVCSLCDREKVFFEHYPEAHRHNFYSIFWIRSGNLLNTIDDHSHNISGNALFFLAPGQVHKMSFAERAEGWLIAFSDAFLCLRDQSKFEGINCSLFFSGASNPVIQVSERQALVLEQTIRLMKNEVDSPKDHYQEAFYNLLRYFLVLVSRISEKQGWGDGIPEGCPKSYLEFRLLIDRDYATLRTVSDYAARLHIGTSQLNKISKQASGLTAGEHIRNRLITEAKRYLHHSDFSSKQIAYKLGFDDPHYFSRFFKKHASQSPQEFRAHTRGVNTPVS